MSSTFAHFVIVTLRNGDNVPGLYSERSRERCSPTNGSYGTNSAIGDNGLLRLYAVRMQPRYTKNKTSSKVDRSMVKIDFEVLKRYNLSSPDLIYIPGLFEILAGGHEQQVAETKVPYCAMD